MVSFSFPEFFAPGLRLKIELKRKKVFFYESGKTSFDGRVVQRDLSRY